MGRRHGRSRSQAHRFDDGPPITDSGGDPEYGSSRNKHHRHGSRKNDRKGQSRRRSKIGSRVIIYVIIVAYIPYNYFFVLHSPSNASGGNGRQQDDRSRGMRKSSQSNVVPTNEAAERFLQTGKLPGRDKSVRQNGKVAFPKGSVSTKMHVTKPVSRLQLLPPLSTAIDGNGNVAKDADISSLLDFSIVGFPKTGTTSVLRHLSDLTISLPTEHCELVVNNTAKLVKGIYEDYDRRLKQSKDGGVAGLRGIKCPQDLSSDWSMHNYAKYFPRTKLIVGIRHPIFWFESLYNFRVSNVPWKSILHTSKLTKGCPPGSQGVCAWRASFHDFLARLGKTPMASKDELKLLSLKLETVRSKVGPVFLYDLSQLSEVKFRQDLRDFLGLTQDIPPFPAVDTSGRFDHIDGVKDETSKKKIDICRPEHVAIRSALMKKAKSASVWMREYFLKSKEVFVSDRPYIEAMLRSWMEDPCG